ncbi:protein of unknown function [Clostridium cavendishii DSM 21758]|uniref:DUF4272 domain-containing protein n=1 Tax=Clostridium cavendishii DSM 21758 TaxID=1121302 RepID=A0A1M6QWL0_9CLOT|nr:DUF4272 domain-containing protein [Clostridium cavendishii]SHK24503.1 protein of unknown function [Clostridium cavendishii DSM 21758]
MGLFNRKKKEEDKKSAVLTLYSVTLDSKNIYEVAKEEFLEVTKSIKEIEGGLEFIFKDETSLNLHLKDDLSFVSNHTNGMANFFSQAPLENKEVLDKAILQIKMFTCTVGITFEINEDERRTNYITNTIYEIAERTQSFVLYPSMELYTSKGELLISINGETDFEKYYPIASSDILKRDVEMTAKDEERYKKIIKECDEKKIPHTSFMLGTQIMEQEVVVPSIEEIAKRAVTIFSCAVYSEGLLMENGSIDIAKYEFEEMNKRYGIIDYISKKEKEYIEMEEPDEITAIQFAWQYERCAVLLWALGFIELNPCTEICNVREIAKILRSYDSLDELMKASNPRNNEELLDMHTRVLYYHWACVDARINNKEVPGGLDSGVVQEQHYALNWLISANGECDWDDISPNT